MSALLEALLKRALPAPIDWTPTNFRGCMVPKWWLNVYEALAEQNR